MPTDEELVKLARRYPAFKHHLQDPNAPFTAPAPDLDVTPKLPEPTEDDRPLTDKFPALRSRDYEAQQAATEAAHKAQREWEDANRLR